jgi:hypothetical protein
MNDVTHNALATLEEWRGLKEEIDAMQSKVMRERKLRKEVADLYCPNPEEGTNTIELPTGERLRLTHKLTRSLDEGAMPAVAEQLRKHGVSPDNLVKWSPKLDTREYRRLDDETRHIMDQCLITKPGSPTLDILEPKE